MSLFRLFDIEILIPLFMRKEYLKHYELVATAYIIITNPPNNNKNRERKGIRRKRPGRDSVLGFTRNDRESSNVYESPTVLWNQVEKESFGR